MDEDLDNQSHLDFITAKNLKLSMRKFKNGKSPGPDEISPAIMKQLPDNIMERLSTLMKASIAISYTPNYWRMGNVMFLQKAGKKDLSCPRAYRPITLASFIFKAMKRLVQWELETNELNKKNYISNNMRSD
jgi:hypothetical protein